MDANNAYSIPIGRAGKRRILAARFTNPRATQHATNIAIGMRGETYCGTVHGMQLIANTLIRSIPMIPISLRRSNGSTIKKAGANAKSCPQCLTKNSMRRPSISK